MSKIIEKKTLHKVIMLNKKWWNTLDDNVYYQLCDARTKAFGVSRSGLNDLINNIICIDKKTPLSTYYKVFEALGYELI